jgi:Tfp pilus assembly protein FimT
VYTVYQKGTTLIELMMALAMILAMGIALILPNLSAWCPFFD